MQVPTPPCEGMSNSTVLLHLPSDWGPSLARGGEEYSIVSHSRDTQVHQFRNMKLQFEMGAVHTHDGHNTLCTGEG